ncbi:unnamed protein product, partial [Sphacelaria rigidula]
TSHRTPSSKTRANNAPRQNNPADAKNLIIPSRVAHSDDDGNDEKATAGCTVDKSFLQPNSPSVPSRAGETNHGGWYAPSPRDQRHTLVGWKVLPTRLAFSLRLERLHPVRPPYSLRAPQQAPPDCSMCRLRLAIAGLSVRASCASFPPSPRSDCSTSVATVWVRWNGHDDGIGKPSEWRMPLNEMEGTGKRDLLLPLPENNRERLRLSLRVAVPGFGNKNNKVTRVTDIDDQEQERSRTTGIVGTVDVGWDGLSCVPVYRTDYFVDACGGRSVLHPSLPVALELAAVPGSYGRFRAASSSPVRGRGSGHDVQAFPCREF